MERRITATRFKAQCLSLLDEVANTGETLVVTKHGRPVARVLPAIPAMPLSNSVTFLVDDDDLIAPVEEHWEAQST